MIQKIGHGQHRGPRVNLIHVNLYNVPKRAFN
jgi:hypothetical protein